MRRYGRSLGCLLTSLAALSLAQADDWPQFRGPNSSGVATSAKGLPEKFSATENVVWSAKLGDSVASPVIVGGRAFTTAMSGETTFSVLAFDAAGGKPLWKRDFETGKLPRITPPNSHASSTPTSDGKRVYAYFSTLGIVAVDAATGEVAWKRPLPLPAYLMDWGAAASPIVHNGLVIFNQDDDLNPALYGIDAETGDIRWKTERPDMLAGYAVPVLCEAEGRTDLVVAGTGKMKGYDPATGKERWTCNTLPRTIMTTPVVQNGVIYLSVQSYGDETRTVKYALLEWLDTNQDGELARPEVPKEFWEKFDRSDANKDAVLKDSELDTAFQSSNNLVGGGSIVHAIRGGGMGDVTKTHVLFNLKNRAPSNLSSCLVVEDQLFVVKQGGISSSFHAKTGEPFWEMKRIKTAGEYFGSPVAGDGKIFVPNKDGFIITLAQGPELKVLSKNDLGEETLATPAIADGRLYVRTRGTLFCIGNE